MNIAFFDFLRSALVPVVQTDVAAGAAGDVHFVLVGVAAVRTAPNQLAMLILDNLNLLVPATALAVIGLCVEFGVHDVVIDVLQHGHDGRNVVGQVGNLDVADGAARRELLELCLELQLGEGVNFLSHMDMVAVGNVTLVCDAFNDAEALLEALGKLVGSGLDGRPIQAVVHILIGLPLLALVVHVLHDIQRELLGLGVSVAPAGHGLDTLIQTSVAQRDGGISVVEELVDGLTFLQAGQSTMLPVDG